MREWAKRILGYDTETTGFGPEARLLEFGAVLIENAKVVTCWQVMCRPFGVDWESPMVQQALKVNGLRMQDIEAARAFHEEFEYIKSALSQSDVRVGHNVQYDKQILKNEFIRAVKEGKLHKDDAKGASFITLDTMALDKFLVPDAKSHNLEAVAGRWGVRNWQKHTAIGDADACIRILSNMSQSLPESLDEVVEINDRCTQAFKKEWAEKYGKGETT